MLQLQKEGLSELERLKKDKSDPSSSSTDARPRLQGPVETEVPSQSSDEDLMSEDEASAKELRAEKRPPADDQSLTQHWKRTKTKGKGVDLVQKYAHLFDHPDGKQDKHFERIGFIQVRLGPSREHKTPVKKPRPKDGDKNLKYSNCSPEIQRGLNQTRAAEWRKLMKFRAGVVLTPEQVEELIADGANVCPMQWVETDKNAYRRREHKIVKLDLKSRLVGCGNSGETEGLRTDSPAGVNDSHN